MIIDEYFEKNGIVLKFRSEASEEHIKITEEWDRIIKKCRGVPRPSDETKYYNDYFKLLTNPPPPCPHKVYCFLS